MAELDLKNAVIDNIAVGMVASCSKTIREADVITFAKLSGDTNPVHLSDEYASGTRFKKRIAHGLISAGLFSALFGTELPGTGCVYVSQTLNFKRPVYIDDMVVAEVKVTSVDMRRKRVVFDTVCRVNDKVVIYGVAELFVPSE